MKKVSYQHCCSWLWRQKCVCVYVWLKNNKHFWWGEGNIMCESKIVWKCHHHQDKQGIQPSVSASIFITFFHLICSLSLCSFLTIRENWQAWNSSSSFFLDPDQQHNHIVQIYRFLLLFLTHFFSSPPTSFLCIFSIFFLLHLLIDRILKLIESRTCNLFSVFFPFRFVAMLPTWYFSSEVWYLCWDGLMNLNFFKLPFYHATVIDKKHCNL